jgi:predicted metal-dependent enzyme (double-stranded beta helix superfamily)
MHNSSDTIAPLREFVIGMTNLVSHESAEQNLISKGSELLKTLIQSDAWLPEFCTVPHPEFYQQFLLHADPLGRFSVVSFVWGPGQKTPIHDHTVWGMVGMMRGQELCEEYAVPAPGRAMQKAGEHAVQPGQVDKVSPSIGDIHVVSNGLKDRASISIHVYGANIGAVARHTFDGKDGQSKPFVSGYSNSVIPNLWDRSADVRASLS